MLENVEIFWFFSHVKTEKEQNGKSEFSYNQIHK